MILNGYTQLSWSKHHDHHGLDLTLLQLRDWPLSFSEPQWMAHRLVNVWTNQESPSHTQDIEVENLPSVAWKHGLERDPGHATCEIDRLSLRTNLDLIQWCFSDRMHAFSPAAIVFQAGVNRKGPKSRWHPSVSPLPLQGTTCGYRNCAVLPSASECFRVLLTPEAQQVSKPGTWRFIPRQKHDFGSVELHLGFKRVKMQITITMRNDTKFVESCFIRFISQNLQFWWNQSNFIWTLRAIYMN